MEHAPEKKMDQSQIINNVKTLAAQKSVQFRYSPSPDQSISIDNKLVKYRSELEIIQENIPPDNKAPPTNNNDAIIEETEDPLVVVGAAINKTKITSLGYRTPGISEKPSPLGFSSETSTSTRVSRGCVSPDSNNTLISGDTVDTDGCETPIIHSEKKLSKPIIDPFHPSKE